MRLAPYVPPQSGSPTSLSRPQLAERRPAWTGLADQGLLTRGQREALAADEGMPGLARALRQAEVAGHDPHQVLEDAVTRRPLEDARSLAGVLHHRITREVSLEPQGDSYAQWVPRVDNPAWQRHLEDLARAADERTAELGHETAQEPPQWAVEALAPVSGLV